MRIIICVLLLFVPFMNSMAAMGRAASVASKTDITQVFRNVKVSGTTGDYVVTGESRAAPKGFFYSVEDGHVEFIKETHVMIKEVSREWQPFQLKVEIPADKLPINGTVLLNLYERSHNGQITQLYPVILERFQ